MIKLFNFTERLSKPFGMHARLVFLLMNIVVWCAAAAVIFVPLCSFFIKNQTALLISLMCLIGYPGVVIGLFGGIIYLILKS